MMKKDKVLFWLFIIILNHGFSQSFVISSKHGEKATIGFYNLLQIYQIDTNN